MNPKNEAEHEALHDILAPHSWAAGEFGLMLTESAFKDCMKSLSTGTEKSIKAFLMKALAAVRKANAGDVCLNFGVTG